jgi:two-component system cell cycle sensor histidine kinase/response regulator CckA
LTAGSGREAVETYLRNQANLDCVLLDVSTFQLTGMRTLVELRRIAADVPVIVSSDDSKENITPGLVGHDAVHFLRKPYVLRDLATVLRDVLESR